MLRDFFIPAALAAPMTQTRQHESYAQSGVIYESAQLSPDYLQTFLEKFRQPAYGFGKGSKVWQERAINAWCAVAREWQTLKFAGAKTVLPALAAATGLSPKMLKAALRNHFWVFDAEVLNAWLREVKRERDKTAARKTRYPQLVFLVNAGNIPGVAIHPLLHLSVLGIPTLVKNAASEPFLMPAILATLARHDPEVASRLAVFTWARSAAALTATVLRRQPTVVAFGDEITMQHFAQQQKPFADFGDRFSLALVNAGSAKTNLRHLAYDLCMFEQMGCLSPQAIILFTADWKKVEKFCARLAAALAQMSTTLPLGKRTPAQHALIQQWRGALAARGAAGEKIILLTSAGTAWTVAAAENFDLNERVAYRFARVWPVPAIKEFAALAQQYKTKLNILIWGSSLAELEKFMNAPELGEAADQLFFNFAGHAQAPNCGWLDQVNPTWRRLTRGLRLPATTSNNAET